MKLSATVTARTVYDVKIGNVTYKAMEPSGELEGLLSLKSSAGTVVIDKGIPSISEMLDRTIGDGCHPKVVDIIKITPSMIPDEYLAKETEA